MICNKCQNQISNNAKFCNNCGASVIEHENDLSAKPPNSPQAKIGIFIGVTVLLLIILTISFSSKAIEVTASQIAEEYRESIVDANKKYKDKKLEISGKVIGKGQFTNSEDIYIELETPYKNKGINVLGSFTLEHKTKINNIKKGDFVKIKGTCAGNVKQQRSNVTSIQIEGKSID